MSRVYIMFFLVWAVAHPWCALAQSTPATQGITIGLALTDSAFAESNLRDVSYDSFYSALESLELKPVQSDAQLVDASGVEVAPCMVLVGPPSSNPLAMFLQLPWKDAVKLLGRSVDSYTAKIVITYQVDDSSGIRHTESQVWKFEKQGEYGRRLDFKLPEEFSTITVKNFQIHLELEGTVKDGNVRSAYNLVCDVPGILRALLPAKK